MRVSVFFDLDNYVYFCVATIMQSWGNLVTCKLSYYFLSKN